MKAFHDLDHAEIEALAHLAEECAEVIMAVAKMQRHGALTNHPDRPDSNNLMDLGREIGNLSVAIEIARQLGLVDDHDVHDGVDSKWAKIDRYLHHINVTKDRVVSRRRSRTPRNPPRRKA